MSRAMSQTEIAQKLGLSQQTVAKIEARALAKLREALERLDRENEARQFERKS